MILKLALMGLAVGALAGAAVAAAEPARTADGHPNLDGVWSANFLLRLEATDDVPELTVPEARAKAIAEATASEIVKQADKQLDPEVPMMIGSVDGLPLVRGQRRTRLVVEPANGKLPYTEAALAAMKAAPPAGRYDNPESRPNSERCLVGLGQPPVTTFVYFSPMRIVQTPDYVVLQTEYGGDLRIIPLTDAHRPAMFKSLLGDSIAHWDGDTLVIETVGLPDGDRQRIYPFYLVPGDSKVIERLTRVSDKELFYQFTVIDPKTYAKPWLAEFSWYATDQPMFESACHEGDHSLRGILAGARRQEALAKAAKPAASQ